MAEADRTLFLALDIPSLLRKQAQRAEDAAILGLNNLDHHAISHDAAKIEIEAAAHGHTVLSDDEKAQLEAVEHAAHPDQKKEVEAAPSN